MRHIFNAINQTTSKKLYLKHMMIPLPCPYKQSEHSQLFALSPV